MRLPLERVFRDDLSRKDLTGDVKTDSHLGQGSSNTDEFALNVL